MDININMQINNYKLLEKISSGSFGYIFKCKSIISNNLYAIKISENLKYEAYIYKLLFSTKNVSNLIQFFKFNNKYDCIILNLYHLNIQQFKQIYFYNPKYKLLSNQILSGIINGLQNIHEKYIIHRDIKPVNICLDYNFIPYIIDFGMAKQYIINKKHIPNGNIHDIIGTINFCSINSINKLQLSRRDDMESFFFLFLYIITPTDIYKNYINKTIYQQKNLDQIYLLLNTDNMKTCIKYIRYMSFTQKPNYKYINQLIFL